MTNQLIYKGLAKYYELIYSWKNTKAEETTVRRLIKKYKESSGNNLLEVACGTGRYLDLLKKYFTCTGIDINEPMLNIARRKVKGVIFKKSNMINFNLKEKFDVILCLFASIGYSKTHKNLKKTLTNLTKHLKSEGIIIIEPWLTEKVYKAGYKQIITIERDSIKITGLAISKLKSNLAIIDTHYLISDADKPIKYFIDRNEVGLFETKAISQIMNNVGLKAVYLKQSLTKGRGLIIGVKKVKLEGKL